MENTYPYLILVMVIIVPLWVFLVHRFTRWLRVHHPAQYQALGAPAMFRNNNLRTNWLFLKFLFRLEFRKLRNPRFNLLCYSLLGFVFVLGTLYTLAVIWLPEFIYTKFDVSR